MRMVKIESERSGHKDKNPRATNHEQASFSLAVPGPLGGGRAFSFSPFVYNGFGRHAIARGTQRAHNATRQLQALLAGIQGGVVLLDRRPPAFPRPQEAARLGE